MSNNINGAIDAKATLRAHLEGLSWFLGVLVGLNDNGYYLRLQVDRKQASKVAKDLFIPEWDGYPVVLEPA